MQVKFVINTGKVINVIVEINIDEIEIHEELAKWIDKNRIFRLIYQDVIDKSKVCDIQVY